MQILSKMLNSAQYTKHTTTEWHVRYVQRCKHDKLLSLKEIDSNN